MSDLLLINPSLHLTRARDKHYCFPWVDSGHGWLFQPALFLVPFLKKHGYSVEVLDMELCGSSEEDALLRDAVLRSGVVGVSAMTSQIPHALEIMKKVKAVDSSTPIVVGGIHASLLESQTREHPLVDAVIPGYGEYGLLNYLSGAGAAEMPEPDEFDLPSFDALDISRYFDFQAGRRNLDIMTSRGCPYRCTFCVNSILKNRWKPLDLNGVKDMIVDAKSRYDFRHTFIMDENLFGQVGRAMSIVDTLRSINVSWEGNAAIRDIVRFSDADMVAIKFSGCSRLRMGAESGSDRILAALNKNITRENAAAARDKCLKHGITPVMSFMINLPDETSDDKAQTLDFVRECSMAGASVIGPQRFRPYPGSVEYEKLVAKGLRIPGGLEEWAKSDLFNTV